MTAASAAPALEPGQIRLFDNAEPALTAGVYSITATSTIADTSEHASFPRFTAPTQRVEVMAPHFTLDPGVIHSMFPPAFASDDYGELLPQIVFTSRMLPWQRDLGPKAPPDAPWLALLLFNPSEMAPASSAVDATFATTGTVADFLTPPQGYAVPQNEADPAVDPETARCRFVDLPMPLFRRIAPQAAELPYLAHWRNVNTSSGAVDAEAENGIFSAVIGNRFPSASEANIVHLVSLAGFFDYLPGGTPPDAPATIRLLSLASWTFQSPATAVTFTERVHALHSGAMQLPVTVPAQPTAVQETVAGIVRKGFVPMAYRRREGARTAGWYRGPLTPVAIAEAAAPGTTATPFQTSDAALIYDHCTGMFELSYAIAWQIGRLIALTKPNYCVDFLKYRNAAKSALLLLQQRMDMARRFSTTLALASAPHDRLRPRAVSRAARDFLLADFPSLVIDEARPLLPRARDKLRLAERWDKVPGVLGEHELAALLASGGDPVAALLQHVFGADEEN